jgi:hypothetical protein
MDRVARVRAAIARLPPNERPRFEKALRDIATAYHARRARAQVAGEDDEDKTGLREWDLQTANKLDAALVAVEEAIKRRLRQLGFFLQEAGATVGKTVTNATAGPVLLGIALLLAFGFAAKQRR